MVIWGKERAWISKQHKAMRNFKGDGTITANKILEANECVCLCLWQWLRGVNRGISSHLRSLNTSHSHNWIRSVGLLLNCRCSEEHETRLAPKATSKNGQDFSFSSKPWKKKKKKKVSGENENPEKWHLCSAARVRCWFMSIIFTKWPSHMLHIVGNAAPSHLYDNAASTRGKSQHFQFSPRPNLSA